ncbi:MAG: GspE/PulE family protein [bacterium]
MLSTTGFPSIEDILKKSIPKDGSTSAAPAAPVGKKKPLTAAERDAPEIKFAEKMAEIRLKELEEGAEVNARRQGLSYINLKGFPINPDALRLVPEERAEAMHAVCFLFTGKELRIGAVNPGDPKVQELAKELKDKTAANTSTYLISEESFRQGFKLYASLPKIHEVNYNVEISAADLEKYQQQIGNVHDLAEIINKVNITDLTTLVLAASVKMNSSDIHIEAEEKDIIIRYRVDGILEQVATIEKTKWPQIIARVKLLSGLKLNIVDRPQDGRITIVLGGEKVEVRVSTLPTAFGESVVMRVLKSTATSLKFDDLGIRGKAGADLKREIERPNGMIITTGPTGSGKSTTLYAILNTLNAPGVKIITLEDPVEYKLQGIAQSQIDHSKNYTFALGLRSILRQDPDIVMVGEIRDLETAEISTQAALTGHLVISTIHTNSAAGAIPRFLSMGVKPFLLAPALNAVIGQRLIRRLHDCKKPITLEGEDLEKVKKAIADLSPASGVTLDLSKVQFYGPGGCEKCHNSGYKGRIGIYEIFTMSKEIEAVILSGAVSEYQMQEIAVKQGMVTMLQDGILKASDGITSIEAVIEAAG